MNHLKLASWSAAATLFLGILFPSAGFSSASAPAGGSESMRSMMQRMMGSELPPGVAPELLPEPNSRGARLLQEYCEQCHRLPGPGMHTASEWPAVVARMDARMEFLSRQGNSSMMGKIVAPSRADLHALLAYLEAHAQKPIERAKFPGLDTAPGKAFSFTCAQCHALPDPRQHTAEQWPAVVARMKSHEAVMGKVVPDAEKTGEIIKFLQQNAGVSR